MSSTFLYLARHGAVINVNGKRYIGQIEAPLSERGVEQAWALRNWLEPVEFSMVLCSDLMRSQRTAKIITAQRDVQIRVCPELREISLGDWEGSSFREIARRFPAEYEARGRDLENWRPPNGESFADCRKRVLPFLNEIFSSSQGCILVVGHAGVNRLILCEALGIPTSSLMSLGQEYGCLNIIEYSDERRRLQLLNYAPLGTRAFQKAIPIDAARAVIY
jgi:probable phosphoglycerate mutase